ncbi:uncharacterized protein LOC143900779 isoform X3 [Temnothorax americanus]|uniref:uncharacterized protein LOC143900779 isoform X3 n=1 Tax=Temnothorax americanus TaxID=1964332 RepID=UPI0040677767
MTRLWTSQAGLPLGSWFLIPGSCASRPLRAKLSRQSSSKRHGSNETMHHLRFDRRVFCAVREKRRWKNLSCHSSPERKKKSMQPMSLSNGNEERFENGLANAPQNMYTYICLTRRRGVPREPPSDDCDTATDLHCPPTALV